MYEGFMKIPTRLSQKHCRNKYSFMLDVASFIQESKFFLMACTGEIKMVRYSPTSSRDSQSSGEMDKQTDLSALVREVSRLEAQHPVGTQGMQRCLG